MTTPRTRKSACPKSTWHSPGSQSSRRNPCASRASSSAASSSRLLLTYLLTVEYEPSKPFSATSRSKTLFAVWRCLYQQRLSSSSHESTSAAKGSSRGDSGALPTAGGLSERSVSLRYFLTVGSETPVSRAIEATLAPPLPSLLISSILSTPIISFPASHRRNRSSDNVRPRWGWSACPCPNPKVFRDHSRKLRVIKSTSQTLSNTINSELCADSILNRAVEHARVLDIKGPNMREYTADLKAQAEKGYWD